MSPFASAYRIAFRLLPRNPDIKMTRPSPVTGDGIGFIVNPPVSQTRRPVAAS
jgi:hypothetical protein